MTSEETQEIPVEVDALDQFKILYDLPAGTHLVGLIGGRGGAKSYEVSKFIAYSATVQEKRCVLLRDEQVQVKESILNEVLSRYDTANEEGVLDQLYERLEKGIKSRETNEMLVFTKGFRASSNQKQANLKSVANVDIAVVEEGEDIRDETKFNVFADSIRKPGSIIIVIMNTPDIQHWFIKRYFNLEPVLNERGEASGYYKITPKKIKGFVCIQTSFEDNPHLPEHIVHNYRSYGDPNSHLYNLHYYMTAILGYASSGRQGQILTKAKSIKLEEYLALPYKEYYGQDFGTASPAGFIGVKVHRNIVWARQINYLPKNTLALGKMYCELDLTLSDEIVADSADKNACDKLQDGWSGHELSDEDFSKYPGLALGFNIIRARKGQDSVKFSLDLLDQCVLYVVEESTDFWNEIYNYVWARDKNGNLTDEPIDDYNHLIDPLRYVVMEKVKMADGWGYKRKN